MSDLYVKKQMYECSKCGALLDSKAEFEKHYDKVHNLEKYCGAYVIAKDGKYVGKIAQTPLSDGRMSIEVVKITTSGFNVSTSFLPPLITPNVVSRKYALASDEIDNFFTVVPLEVAKEHLESQIRNIGYDLLEGKVSFVKDFRDGPIKEKGDEDGD